LIRSCAKRDMHKSKRGALTVNASMEDETEDGDETEKESENRTAPSCHMSQLEARLWLVGVDES
jgi:hypothetical protein